MKSKAFSLIEILVATMIFMTVIVVTIVAFAMVKKSNEISGDSMKTDECSRQVENFIGSVFRSASYGNPRIMAIVRSSGSFLLKDISSLPEEEINAAGFAIFEKSDEANKIIANFIFKNIDPDLKYTGYFYKSSTVNRSNVEDGDSINSIISFNSSSTDPQKIHFSDCVPLYKTNPIGFAGNYKNPFFLKLVYPYEGGPSSQIGNSIFTLKLNDLVYYILSAQDNDDKTMSKIYLEVANNIKPI